MNLHRHDAGLRGLRALALLFTLLLVAIFARHAAAGEIEDRRLRISVEIFPRIVAVDQDIRDKLSDSDVVRLFVVFDRDIEGAQRIAESMRTSITNIGGRAVEFILQSAEKIVQHGLERPSAVFLSENLGEKSFMGVMGAAVEKHVLVFSPFAGDVERGATVGIAISSRIKPFFNVPTLNRSHISINEKLLSISQRYE